MYEPHWQLNSRPFENTANTSFYYPSEAHQGAMLKLRYVIENRRGAATLTGAAGLGKTMLIACLRQQMQESGSMWVHVVFPQMPANEIVAYIADELVGEIAPLDTPVHQHVRRIESVLVQHAEAGKHTVLVVDEAHLLGSQTLEALRLMLNFEHQGEAPLTIFLVGQPALLPMLDRTPELDERMGVKCLLRRLTIDESLAYVNHRVTTAGAQQAIFDDAAMETIHQLSHGSPRQINRLCDLALLIGFAEELSIVGPEQIESVAEELVTVSPE